MDDLKEQQTLAACPFCGADVNADDEDHKADCYFTVQREGGNDRAAWNRRAPAAAPIVQPVGVGVTYLDMDGCPDIRIDMEALMHVPAGTIIYASAAPVAQAEPVAPEDWKLVPLKMTDVQARETVYNINRKYKVTGPLSDFLVRQIWEWAIYAAPTTTAADAKDAARASGWQPIIKPGQVRVGDKLRFTIGDDKYSETAKELLHAGTDQEEIIYNKRRNYYLITSMAIANRGSQKNVEFRAAIAPSADEVKS